MSSDRRPRRGLMMAISSPSGVGKTSLSRRLVADHPELELSTSCTTRSPRPGERDGREYHFVNREQFERMIADNAFLEWAEVHDNLYGSPAPPVMQALENGHDVLFDIDWQGALSIAAYAPEDVIKIYILPPSMAEMARRIHARAADTLEVIEGRLGRAKAEIVKWPEYDYIIVNDDFDRAYADLAHIYHAERLKRARNAWVGPFVDGLLDEPV